MKELPKSEWTFHQEAPDSVIVGAWEYPAGYRWYEKFQLSDLPNDFVSLEDLERIGIDLNHCRAVVESEPLAIEVLPSRSLRSSMLWYSMTRNSSPASDTALNRLVSCSIF
jgi:hypothetical protein